MNPLDPTERAARIQDLYAALDEREFTWRDRAEIELLRLASLNNLEYSLQDLATEIARSR